MIFYRMGASDEDDRKAREVRDAEIVRLRETGLSYRQIAKRVGGISAGRAMQIVTAAKKKP